VVVINEIAKQFVAFRRISPCHIEKGGGETVGLGALTPIFMPSPYLSSLLLPTDENRINFPNIASQYIVSKVLSQSLYVDLFTRLVCHLGNNFKLVATDDQFG
jgi:hypothetical protein